MGRAGRRLRVLRVLASILAAWAVGGCAKQSARESRPGGGEATGVERECTGRPASGDPRLGDDLDCEFFPDAAVDRAESQYYESLAKSEAEARDRWEEEQEIRERLEQAQRDEAELDAELEGSRWDG